MLSKKQFGQALDFLSTYEDSLKCIEQVAERKQGFSHYKNSTATIGEGLANGEIALGGDSVIVPAAGADNFIYKRAFLGAKKIFDKYKLGSATSKDEFVSAMNNAEAGLQ